ncbi:iron ABC transporter permease [Campylobacter sp. MIT 99-7217]|uniref:FecCD family ABC transporter permease n=1 Tax=Campylobacter sp. MIT 99-7217 TaxID=535091 RepID=UPI0011582382|nr:iron ABC transporter permease [Campylobacter sp. MIT 99-7217]TQR33698.1 iron ABC transporter permease [Campylobacter sp. MIT 99-7217]
MKILFALIFIIILSLIILGIGRFELSYLQIFDILLGKTEGREAFILLELRLPRVILALIVGASLSVAGASFQAIFRNPLASPDILGVASGAAFGAVLALLLGLNIYLLTAFSFSFGLLSLALVLLIAKDSHNKIMIILSGVIISALFQSFISLLKYIADPQDTLPVITYWLLGSLQVGNLKQMIICSLGMIIGSIIIVIYRFKHNILMLEDIEARSLGLNIKALRLGLIFASTLIVACVVSICGIIGWIGLIVPHIARMIAGFNTAKVIATSLFIGAIFMLIIDTLSRSLAQQELPISILSAVVGAPFFIAILYKAKGMRI